MSQAERATKASQETDYLSSDLSNENYKYDLVVGTTAQAINATMKQYLFKKAPEPVEIWYGQEAAGKQVVPMTAIDGVDPFDTPNEGEPPQEILDSDFVFAIKAGFGLPDGVDPLSVPDILVLSEDKHKVTYVLFFNTFEIVTLDWGRRGTHAWSHFTQPSGEPILFKYLVDMNFDEADPEASFHDLPPETRDRLKDLNTNTAFSVQQLYLDLNNAGLQSMPEIGGIPTDSDVYIVLEKDFINTYWRDMHDDGKFILGYAAKAHSDAVARTSPDSGAASIQPTDLNFDIVPHYGADGTKTDNFKLYTLNYLMNSGDRPLPQQVVTFPWNWVRSSDVDSYHGAMAVRREDFAAFLNDGLSQHLSRVCINPWTSYKYYWDYSLLVPIQKARVSYQLRHDSAPGKFTYHPVSGKEILRLSYNKKSESGDRGFLQTGHFNLYSAVTGTVSVSGTEFTVVLNGELTVDIKHDAFGAGNVTGLVGGYSCTAVYIVAVDGRGDLTVKMKRTYPKQTVTPSNLTKGLFAGLDGTTRMESELESSYNAVGEDLRTYERLLAQDLNRAGNMWVFPGGQTFMFKQAAFSNFQDLVTHITFADPS